MKATLVTLAIFVAAAVIMGAYIGLTATGQLSRVPLSELPDATLSLEVTEDGLPLAGGSYRVTRPGFFDQQVAVGATDIEGMAKIKLKSGIVYTISIEKSDGSACRIFDVELFESAGITSSCK